MNRFLRQQLFGAALAAAAFAAAPCTASTSIEQQLQARTGEFFTGTQPGGVVLVRKGDTTLLRRAYGLSDVENQVAMRPDSVLRLASASKQFTAMAVLKLVAAGKLELDQPLGQVDPGLPAAIGAVSIRQLLTHTSGIKNISSIPESRAARRQEASAESLIDFFKDLPLEFAPGSRFKYSNSNYILLTRVIELASGKSYAEHLQEAIFAPLDMRQTLVGDHLGLVPHRAMGYQRRKGELMNADFISMSQPQGAGALLSTVDDLAKWDRALSSDGLVPRKLLEQAFEKVTLSDGSRQPYGFGWVITQIQGEPSMEHSGFINGFNAYVLRMPAQQVFVTVLTNAEFLVADDLAVELAAIAIGKRFERSPAMPADLANWVGRYDFGEGNWQDVSLLAGKLQARQGEDDAVELKPAADGRYYLGESLDFASFGVRSDGRAEMTLHNRFMGKTSGLR